MIAKDQFLGNNQIWQKDNKFCYTNPDGTYEFFSKHINLKEIQKTFCNIKYYKEYRNRVNEKGTKFGELDNVSMYPFAMPLNTWIFSNLKYDIENFVPNYEDFCTFYINNYCHYENGKLTFNDNACDRKVYFSDVDLRVRIGYPYGSFLRELYIRIAMIEYFKRRNVDIHVLYNIIDDYYNATDIILNNGNKMLGVCILDKSKNSTKMKERKNEFRHKTQNNALIVENKQGFLSTVSILPRLDFYTDIWSKEVDTLGDIKVPKISNIEIFCNTVIEYFKKEK